MKQPQYFDQEARAAEKEATRAQDEQELRLGKATPGEIQARNGLASGLDLRNARITGPVA